MALSDFEFESPWWGQIAVSLACCGKLWEAVFFGTFLPVIVTVTPMGEIAEEKKYSSLDAEKVLCGGGARDLGGYGSYGSYGSYEDEDEDEDQDEG